MPLKSPEQLLANALVADPAVAAVVGQRVYPVVAPASASLPFITWRRTGIQRTQSLSGPMGMGVVLLSVDVYAETYGEARDIADRCRSVLDGYGTAVENYVSVRNVSLDTESDGVVQLAGGDLPPILTVNQQYSILWQEI
jgi:hypothetical protein